MSDADIIAAELEQSIAWSLSLRPDIGAERIRNPATAERDHWIRLFNRLEATISHHKKATGNFSSDADERLYAARDKIMRDAAK